MLQLILGTNWRANRDEILSRVALDVSSCQGGRVLLVPEQASHDYERRLCACAGDTASRYAEVLSFTRLASRVASLSGGIAVSTLDAGGRLLAMAAAVQQLRPQLKAYAAVGSRPEFLSALVTAVDEFKSCCITSAALKTAAASAQGALAQKLEELSLLLEAYDGICAGFGQDPRDRMTRLLEQLETDNFPRHHVFYIDGFSDFTVQELEILSCLLRDSQCVTVSLTCDRLRSNGPGFELAGHTGGLLLRLASEAGVEARVITLPDPDAGTPLGQMRCRLLEGSVNQISGLAQQAKAMSFASPREECVHVAASIRNRLMQGLRCRDICIVMADPETYTPLLTQTLHQYRIPAYFAGTDDILHKPVIYTVMTALEAAVGGFEQSDVLRYLKSVLSPLSFVDCDRLENYCITWGIRRRLWTVPFSRHPRGLGRDWTEEDRQTLECLNRSREAGVAPLVQLRDTLSKAQCVREQLQGLYRFLEQVELPHRLDELADRFAAGGDAQGVQELEQLWDILIGAMEQMAALLGETQQEADVFLRLFRLLISQYHVGTIPQTLDSVTVGPVSAMRRHEAKYVYILGVQEGLFPPGGTGGMVLTESERQSLKSMGIPLQATLYTQLEQELAGIFAVACAPTEGICFTSGQGQSAHVFRRLQKLLGQEDCQTSLTVLEQVSDLWDGSALYLQAQVPAEGDFLPVLNALLKQGGFTPGQLQPQTVKALYGKELRLSASQVDKAASCRFAYFMRYGLGIRERKELSVDPAEFGTFVHDVLEHTARQVMEQGGFHQISLEQVREMAIEYAQAYQRNYFSDLSDDSGRLEYLFHRNIRELLAVVDELWEELSQSDFEPAGFEVEFGPQGQMPPVSIPGGAMPAYLRGFVDRLDLYTKNGSTYVRVVDYKTGRKDFDYCDVFNGLGLQMLIYLFALGEYGDRLLDAAPEMAGVLYFPARSPILPMKGKVSDDQAQSEHRKNARRHGLILWEPSVLSAMDHTEDFRFLSVKLNKSGECVGDLASYRQFRQLRQYVMGVLRGLVNQIAAGQVDPNPYFRGEHDACRFCEYKDACHLDLWGKPRVYQKMERTDFWTQVEKEVEHHGK